MYHDPVITFCYVVFMLLNGFALAIITAWSITHRKALKELKKKEKKK